MEATYILTGTNNRKYDVFLFYEREIWSVRNEENL